MALLFPLLFAGSRLVSPRTSLSSATVPVETPPRVADTESYDYDWRRKWYAVCFEENLPANPATTPMAWSVYGQPIVLWKDGDGKLRAVEDSCKHRRAALSEGRIRDGKLECLYHGWQFQHDGECVTIPQLPEGAPIPRAACLSTFPVRVVEGIVWVCPTPSTKWRQSSTDGHELVPTTPGAELAEDLAKPKGQREFRTYNFQIDLPCAFRSYPQAPTVRSTDTFILSVLFCRRCLLPGREPDRSRPHSNLSRSHPGGWKERKRASLRNDH